MRSTSFSGYSVLRCWVWETRDLNSFLALLSQIAYFQWISLCCRSSIISRISSWKRKCMSHCMWGGKELKWRLFFLKTYQKLKQGVAEEGERNECKITLGKKKMLQCKGFEGILDWKPEEDLFEKCCQILYRPFQCSDWKKFDLWEGRWSPMPVLVLIDLNFLKLSLR